MTTIDKIRPYAKAIIGFVSPGVVGLVAAVQDSSPGGGSVTGPEWVGIAAACILTGGAVFATPNKDPNATHQDESVQPPEPNDDPPRAGDVVIVRDEPLPPEGD